MISSTIFKQPPPVGQSKKPFNGGIKSGSLQKLNQASRRSDSPGGDVVTFSPAAKARMAKSRQPSFTGNPQKLAEFLQSVTRYVDDETGQPKPEEAVQHIKDLLQEKIANTPAGEPLIFALPAFPFKSPSPEKTISREPDGAEAESVKFLKGLVDKMEAAYEDKIQLKIYSDGIFFAPIKGVPLTEVTNYSDKLRAMIGKDNPKIKLNSLDKIFPDNYQEKAAEIVEKYGLPLAEIKKQIKDKVGLINNQFNHVHRFYSEELKGISPNFSLNKIKKLGKEWAYKVIWAAGALNNWLKDEEPNAVRLSVHPQAKNSSKIYIPLNPLGQNTTPWHSTLVYGDDYKLRVERPPDGSRSKVFMKAKEARDQGITEVITDENGNPFALKAPAGHEIKLPDYAKTHQPPGLN